MKRLVKQREGCFDDPSLAATKREIWPFAHTTCSTIMFVLFYISILSHHPASAESIDFSFGVIGQVIKTPNDNTYLAQVISESDANNFSFGVINGFNLNDELCTDQLYEDRLELLSSAKNGLILTLAGSDWDTCKSADGLSTAVERLSRLREIFFADEFSFGANKIPVIRQSNIPKFRTYAENARWEIGNILFITINLPANNNHYQMEAGRNSEFEDRLTANHYWLQHAFAIATRKKMVGIVLFCDGNPLLKLNKQHLIDTSTKRDGFAEVSQQLSVLSNKFTGKVLIIHNHSAIRHTNSPVIIWHGNIGDLQLTNDWANISVKSDNPSIFNATSLVHDTVIGSAKR